jgi:hypothetical protein
LSSFPYELRGTGTMELRPNGLHAEIAFPLGDAVDADPEAMTDR